MFIYAMANFGEKKQGSAHCFLKLLYSFYASEVEFWLQIALKAPLSTLQPSNKNSEK